jgi:hypothetical protein
MIHAVISVFRRLRFVRGMIPTRIIRLTNLHLLNTEMTAWIIPLTHLNLLSTKMTAWIIPLTNLHLLNIEGRFLMSFLCLGDWGLSEEWFMLSFLCFGDWGLSEKWFNHSSDKPQSPKHRNDSMNHSSDKPQTPKHKWQHESFLWQTSISKAQKW